MMKKIWITFAIILPVTLIAEYWMHPHPHFTIDGTPVFHAWYGFVACIAIVLVSKLLGFVLKRPMDYYEGGADE
jgi:hypothetical protein